MCNILLKYVDIDMVAIRTTLKGFKGKVKNQSDRLTMDLFLRTLATNITPVSCLYSNNVISFMLIYSQYPLMDIIIILLILC